MARVCGYLVAPLLNERSDWFPLAVALYIGAGYAAFWMRNAMGHFGIEFHPRWWVDSPLDVFTTTTHHDLHHQRVRGNDGLYFTWWDRWMGTEFVDYKDRFREAAQSGSSGQVVPRELRTAV